METGAHEFDHWKQIVRPLFVKLCFGVTDLDSEAMRELPELRDP